jgi:pimeloyl-ACP methyl ester carboxylesterase
MPPQVAGNLFIADYIARQSLKKVTKPDGSEGWSWRFDPNMWAKLDRGVMSGLMGGGPPQVAIPLVHIYGERSAIISRRKEGGPSPLPPQTLEIAIPDSAHHIMIDQPLALISALRGLLAVWPGA